MAALILGWYVLAETGSVIRLTAFGALHAPRGHPASHLPPVLLHTHGGRFSPSAAGHPACVALAGRGGGRCGRASLCRAAAALDGCDGHRADGDLPRHAGHG
jgi:hypothetical protein